LYKTKQNKTKQVEWRKDWFYEFNLGTKNDGSDHPWINYIDASFALVTDEWKYVHWPQHNYDQLFHRSVDPYDEWDLLNKILRPKESEVEVEVEDGENGVRKKKVKYNSTKNGCCDDIQTTIEIYNKMKTRYAVLKKKAQSGERI